MTLAKYIWIVYHYKEKIKYNPNLNHCELETTSNY